MIKRKGNYLRPKGLKRVAVPKRANKRPSKPKQKSISKLIKEADRLFSIFVRSTALGGMEGYNNCFTCGRMSETKKLHCGHYLSRFYKAARWDYDNARPQCMMCNLWKRGDPITFRQNLVKEIGIERVEAVEAKRTTSTKLTREFLEALIISLSTTDK